MRNVLYVLILFTFWQSCSSVRKISYTAPPSANVQEMQFTWPDGSVNIGGELLKPDSFQKIVIIAGPEGPNPRYIQGQLIDSLLANSIAVLTYDERGTGNSSGDFSSAGYFDLAADITLIARNLRRSFGLGVAIGVVGIGDGGWKAMIAANYDKRIEFLGLVGTPGMNGSLWLEEQVKNDHKAWRLKKEKPDETLDHYREIHRILSARKKPETQLRELENYLDNIKVSKKKYRKIISPLFRSRLTFIPSQYTGKNMPITLSLIRGVDKKDQVEWQSLSEDRPQIEVQTASTIFSSDENDKLSELALNKILAWLSSLSIRDLD